jgi:hypothetical protein
MTSPGALSNVRPLKVTWPTSRPCRVTPSVHRRQSASRHRFDQEFALGASRSYRDAQRSLAKCRDADDEVQPPLEQLLADRAESGRRAPEVGGNGIPVAAGVLEQGAVAGNVAPAGQVVSTHLGMELEAIGGGAEAESLIGAGDRARERDRAWRQVEAVLVPAEDG